MPGWNECGIYDEACRNQTCAHPTNPKNQGVQCRTMLSQRPCGSAQCTRDECSKPLSAPESAPQTLSEGEPQGDPVRLSRDELWSVWRAVRDRLPTCQNEHALWSAWNKLNDALEL